MKVFTSTNYREHGARNLVEYLDKDNGLKDRTGERMSDDEIEAFVEQSEEYGFERQVIISPQNGDRLSDHQFSHYTRRVMSEYCTDRQTATYCFAIHRDTANPHTQVALTGTKRDLRMDKADCEKLRERAHEHFIDKHRELTREVSKQLESRWRAMLDQEYQADRPANQADKHAPVPESEPHRPHNREIDPVSGADRENDVGVNPEPTTTHHRETRLDREADPEREHGHNRRPGPEHHRGGRS